MASKTKVIFSYEYGLNTFYESLFIILMTSAKLKQKKCEKREIEKINGKYFFKMRESCSKIEKFYAK